MCTCTKAIATAAHGAVGLTKTAMQAVGIPIDQSPPEVAATRLEICRGCDELKRSTNPKFVSNRGLTNLSQCRKCSCIVKAKVGIKSEKCPLGKW